MDWFRNRIPPPLVAGLVALVMAGLAGTTGELTYIFPGQRWVALGLVNLALLVMVVAILQFRKAKTTIDPLHPRAASSLVSSGIFGLSRNPMYLGMLVFLIAWAIYLGNLPALLMPAAFVAWMNRFQIAPEEEALRANFGAGFADYCRRTRRWI
jgi:protein-S-isoprenylcysteine O-methyltransferase Ste14